MAIGHPKRRRCLLFCLFELVSDSLQSGLVCEELLRLVPLFKSDSFIECFDLQIYKTTSS